MKTTYILKNHNIYCNIHVGRINILLRDTTSTQTAVGQMPFQIIGRVLKLSQKGLLPAALKSNVISM